MSIDDQVFDAQKSSTTRRRIGPSRTETKDTSSEERNVGYERNADPFSDCVNRRGTRRAGAQAMENRCWYQPTTSIVSKKGWFGKYELGLEKEYVV